MVNILYTYTRFVVNLSQPPAGLIYKLNEVIFYRNEASENVE